ncbi:hypothetical protein D9758_017193 [Tetrapyrgos nigripes]|uniref:Uncharacterized protein n=1 Tax=Tetrapyrgos nigripes TaxID=182062 RepID=A0A8H5FCG4_9AGAR|nr:hypothetical protein D9758_017193 [Tetrapyrgos nigripes]
MECCTCTQTHQNQNQTPEQGQCFMPVPLLKQNSLFHDIGPMSFVQAPSLVPWMLEEVPLEIIGDRLLWSMQLCL